MASPKPTYQQRLFADEDLPLPLHDMIVRWADKNLRAVTSPICRALDIEHLEDSCGSTVTWGPASVEYDFLSSDGEGFRKAIIRAAKRLAGVAPPPEKIVCSGVTWEHIISNSRSTIVGAIDLAATLRIPYLQLSIQTERIYSAHRHSWLAKMVEGSGSATIDETGAFLNGRKIDAEPADVHLDLDQRAFVTDGRVSVMLKSAEWYHSKHDYRDIRIFVEAKTKITTAGELLRQMNLYRNSIDNRQAKFLVVAPANQWEPEIVAVLNEQGIHTINYLAN